MVRSGKNAFKVCWQYIIWRYQDILGHMKTLYSSKYLWILSIYDFWAQNVLIPPDQNLSKSIDQNVLILFVSNIYNGDIKTFWPRKLWMKTWHSSTLWINFSCIIFWTQNVPIPSNLILLVSLSHFAKNIEVLSVWTKSNTVYTTVITCLFELDWTRSRIRKTMY